MATPQEYDDRFLRMLSERGDRQTSGRDRILSVA
jgi:hypothetical protein